jgi:hypothetical protein
MEIDVVLAFGRAAERIIIIFFCGMSLWFGWKLFYRATDTADHSGDLTWKSFAFRFQKVGPGVFFALFGAVVLAIALRSPVEIKSASKDGKDGGSVSYLGDSGDGMAQLVAMNVAARIASLPKSAPIAEADRAALSAAKDEYQVIRLALVKQIAGPEDYYIWQQFREMLSGDPDSIPEKNRAAVARVQSLLEKWKLP